MKRKKQGMVYSDSGENIKMSDNIRFLDSFLLLF